MSNWKIKAAGVVLLLATVWYLPWALSHLNRDALLVSLPFAAASLMTAVMALLTAINHWRFSVPEERPVPAGHEPEVAVIVPTCGEPPMMVYATAKSVLEQDYPHSKIRLVISDDAHAHEMSAAVERLRREHPDAFVAYHEPPRKGDSRRRGDAKAGNLNSVLDALDGYAPGARYVETRDADDLVGDPGFLRQVVGQLQAAHRVAFVQTIKEAMVSPGDPFGNLEPLFYRRAMLARNAVNSVFPCGSGLVWRLEALHDIGGFPTWNLVEDLQSGVEALRRGWRGVYLPIVGAVGQTAPEDIPNAVKQRGTWALDTMRLTIWGNRRGLDLRQNIQFAQLGFFYLLSFATIIIVLSPVLALAFDTYPFVATHTAYALRFWPFAAAIELMLISIADGLPYETLWRARQTWLGMTPVYAKAAIIALVYGPNRKPTYRVTRKEHVCGLHLKEALPQILIFLALIAASLYHIATHSLLQTADLGSLFWATLFVLGLSRVVRNSWHGAELDALAGGAVRRYRIWLSGWGSLQVAAFRRRFSTSSHPASRVLSASRGGETGLGSVRQLAADAAVERNWREGSR